MTVSLTSLNFKGTLADGGAMTLRAVDQADGDFLLAVYASTRADEMALVPWSAEQKDAFVKWQAELQRTEYESTYPGAEYDIILIDGQPAGRIWIARNQDEIRLLDIALLPEFQNRGAGSQLLRQLIDESRQTSTPLRHMVFVHNNNAQRFYDRLGFVVIDDLGAYRQMEWRTQAS